MANHFAHPASRDRPGSTGGIIALRDMAGPRRRHRHSFDVGRIGCFSGGRGRGGRGWPMRPASAAVAGGAAREQRLVERQQKCDIFIGAVCSIVMRATAQLVMNFCVRRLSSGLDPPASNHCTGPLIAPRPSFRL